ncbi:hypothetical protein C8Q76DRAFT_163922 [Earliella scabrosa]|nr:hypothetical protein C8Q76DRAFT_163922 [Earliella scabrosa]
MPPVDEHGADTPRGSFDMTRPPTMYSPLPHTPNDVPLLHHTELDSHHHLSPDHPAMATRASFDSMMSSAENSSQQQHYLDDAPAYETVILNDEPAPISTSQASPPSGTTPSPTHGRTSTEQSGTSTNRRRSMFASLFNPRSSRGATSPPPAAPPAAVSPEPRSSSGHTREGSGPSIMSVQASERDPRRSRILRHHPSHSGSGSMFSLLSRTRSGQNLNGVEGLSSPSMISLHSISSPLTHTLVKTEFTYPKGGPTPDQLKLISSRESFARFGKPYGADAIAFAASASRAELEPPPGFEEVTSGAGPSSSSQPGRDTPSSGSHQDELVEPSANASSSSDSPQAVAVETHVLPGAAEVESPTSVPSPTDPRPSTPARSSDAPAPISSSPSSSSSGSDVVHAHPPPGLSTQPEPEQPQFSTSPSSTARPSIQPAPTSRSPALVSPAPVPTPTSNAPPSAFKGFATTPTGTSFPARAASRASSYMSYATAEESLHSPNAFDSQYDLSGYESAAETPVVTAPPTPRITPRHVHEETDTTITPGR